MRVKRGKALWKKAKKIIPGGSQLLSKNSEQFLPEQWPSYYKKAKGIEVWDLDGNRFLDFSIMGVGSCILGYADPDVNKAVKNAIDNGSMCTLNCPEEIELADVLLKMHPWAGKVRYARTGGEVMTVAIRIARAFSGKDRIAFCGYHGWHDWYLSANLAEDRNLDGHLLPGLKPLGVPRGLRGTTFPFTYNNVEELESIMRNNEIGVIVMEPLRNYYPEDGFLNKVRALANKHNAVLIFDEITSGFRLNVGGAHQLLGVEPDITVYAKAISNGYPMGAVVGKSSVMDKAEESFISSTYWTERIGPAAALATIKKMKEENVPRHLVRTGDMITSGWQELAKKSGIKIKTSGISPLTHFSFDYQNPREIMTLFTQEMLKRGFLARDSVYVSYSHKEKYVKMYLKTTGEVFKTIKRAIDKRCVSKLLEGPVAHTGFRRLT